MKMTDTISELSSGDNPVISYRTKIKYRRTGFFNLLKMGHCAPAVMETIRHNGITKDEWLVRMTTGLPGGIGNTGFECGGITSPLIQLGIEYGLQVDRNGLPIVIPSFHDYLKRFKKCNNSVFCREILGKRRVPLPCIKAVSLAPELYHQTGCRDEKETISPEAQEAYRLLYSYMSEKCFHCSHTVMKQLGDIIPVTQDLLDATGGFIGGTAFQGLTCSAFTAGLMAVGLKLGETEDSYIRVMRMLAAMVIGGNALADDMNKTNRLMNIGNRMSKWFAKEFGSTLCREITECDFSSSDNISRYIEKGTLSNCQLIVGKVAGHAREIIIRNGVDSLPATDL